MDKVDLGELAERVEKLGAADRSVDYEIHRAVAAKDSMFSPEKYTRSLDAAMSLVPEGWVWTINQFPDKAAAYCVNSACEMARPREQYQATPALALTAAALRARLLQQRGE